MLLPAPPRRPQDGAISLTAALVLMIDHYARLISSNIAVNGLPWLLAIAAFLGVAVTTAAPKRTRMHSPGSNESW